MRISSILSIVKSQIVNKKQTSSVKESKLNVKDTVSISKEAKLLQKDNADFIIAKNALSQLPSVREDRIRAVQEKIKNNEYSSPAFKTELLNKIVGSGLFNNEIRQTGLQSIRENVPDVRELKLDLVRDRIKEDYYSRKDVVQDLSNRILKEFGL